MKILVANLGSTSFKYRLYDLGVPSEAMLARGAVERIGSDSAKVKIQTPKGEVEEVLPIADHGVAVKICLDQFVAPGIGVIQSADEVSAIGFKAVHARNLSGVVRVDDGGARRHGRVRRGGAGPQPSVHESHADPARTGSRIFRS